MKNIEITAEPIELYKILKLEALVASGGEAKHVIAEGLVKVNGEVETRKRKNIFSGDVIEFGDERICLQIKQEIWKMTADKSVFQALHDTTDE